MTNNHQNSASKKRVIGEESIKAETILQMYGQGLHDTLVSASNHLEDLEGVLLFLEREKHGLAEELYCSILLALSDVIQTANHLRLTQGDVAKIQADLSRVIFLIAKQKEEAEQN